VHLHRPVEIVEISTRASRCPTRSIFQAACRTISLAASISARLSAIHCCTVCRVANGLPGASSRSAACRHIISNARSQMPIQRMQWWIRPGPRRSCASAKPAPRPPSRFSFGTRQRV